MIEITDEMVDTAALAVLNALRRERDFPEASSVYGAIFPERFQAQARAAIAAVAPLIAAAEREECARIAAGHAATGVASVAADLSGPEYSSGVRDASERIARDIRARGAS